MRHLQEMALEWGRKRRSPQTGYVHHFYQAQETETPVTIPIVENFLFALALLRTRSVDSINEAKVLLNGLLHFQNQNPGQIGEGNFPLYLHEFPLCRDREVGVHVAAVMVWILKHFHHVLGQELRKRLEHAFIAVVNHALKTHAAKATSYPIAIKIAATAKAGGALLQHQDLEEAGTALLDRLSEEPDLRHWFCPASIGTILLALSMIYPSIKQSPWNLFWKHVDQTWHRQTGCYIGPALKVWQLEEQPQVTTYDLFLGCSNGNFADRIQKDSPVHLEGVMIQPTEDVLEPISYPLQLDGEVDGNTWMLFHGADFAYSLTTKKKEALSLPTEKGFHSFYFIWGDLRRNHTFVCQNEHLIDIHSKMTPDGIHLWGNLDQPLESEDREKNREIVFFTDVHQDSEFLVSGQKASTFRLGETISYRSHQLLLTLKFNLEEGEGRFLGHRMLK